MDNVNAFLLRTIFTSIALLSLTARSTVNAIQPHSTDWATQGFFFDWNNPNTVMPTPITAQCETLNIHWNRAAGTGPDPIPPYFLRVHSSAINSSTDSFQLLPAGNTASTQLTIPFPPGTLYVICMTDSVGISGGCQDLYTVYPTPTNQTCRAFTPPAKFLGMKAISSATQGTISRWGWPSSCTDLELEPIDDASTGGIKGTPPYTLSVAPALRPPLNITFGQSVKWTITLDRSTPFFLTVSDANGVTWTDGPMHAGEGDTSCLSEPTDAEDRVKVSVTLGAAVGAFVIGGILASTVFWLVVRRHRNQRPFYQADKPQPSNNKPSGREPSGNTGTTHARPFSTLNNPSDGRTKKRPNNYGPLGSHDSANSARQRSPENNPTPQGPPIRLRSTLQSSSSSRLSMSSLAVSPSVNTAVSPTSNPPVPGAVPVHEVFVVHHDGGAPPPVTVYAMPGSRVTELPPGYNFDSRPPESEAGDSPTQTQPPLPLPLPSTTPTPSRRDQKALYTPPSRPTPPITLTLDVTSQSNPTPDERGPTVTPSRTRGPRPMSPPQ